MLFWIGRPEIYMGFSLAESTAITRALTKAGIPYCWRTPGSDRMGRWDWGGDGSASRFEKPYYIYVKKRDKGAAEQIVAQVRREQRGR